MKNSYFRSKPPAGVWSAIAWFRQFVVWVGMSMGLPRARQVLSCDDHGMVFVGAGYASSTVVPRPGSDWMDNSPLTTERFKVRSKRSCGNGATFSMASRTTSMFSTPNKSPGRFQEPRGMRAPTICGSQNTAAIHPLVDRELARRAGKSRLRSHPGLSDSDPPFPYRRQSSGPLPLSISQIEHVAFDA